MPNNDLSLFRPKPGPFPIVSKPDVYLGDSPPGENPLLWSWERQGSAEVIVTGEGDWFSWIHQRPDTSGNHDAVYLFNLLSDNQTPTVDACLACTYGSNNAFFGICLKGQNGEYIHFGFETTQNFANGWITARHRAGTDGTPTLLLQERVTTKASAVWFRISYVVATNTATFYVSLDGEHWVEFGSAVQSLGTDVLQMGIVSSVSGLPGVSGNVFSIAEV